MIVEYSFLLVAMAIPTMLGIALGGIKLKDSYMQAKKEILRPLP